MRAPSAAGLLVAAAAALFLLLRDPELSSPPPAASVPAPAARPVAPAAVPEAPSGAVSLPPLPSSLQGTRPVGRLEVGPDGRFLPTPGALRLFDYFLSAEGEEPADVIRARIVAHARQTLPADAARDAVGLLDTYLGFRTALRAVVEGEAAPADLERRLQWVRELRRAHFGAGTAEALFGEEEAVVRVDLERRRVQRDPSLTPREREEALSALDARLPADVREGRQQAVAPLRVREEVAALREAGADDAEVFAARERAFGTEAAERLATLDRERTAWQQRVDAYRAERDALLAGPAVADAELAAALAALRDDHFDANELARIRALDAAEARGEVVR